MPLHAVDGEPAAQAAAATIFDHVARALHRRRFAHHAIIQPLATFTQSLAHHHGAVVGGAFFIAGDQKPDVQRRLRMGGHIILRPHDHGGQRPLHVAGTAPVQLAIVHHGVKRRRCPLLCWPRRHHIHMAGKYDGSALRPLTALAQSPEVAHKKLLRPTVDALARKTVRLQLGRNQIQATAIFGRDRGTSDQLLRKAQGGIRHIRHIRSKAKAEKQMAAPPSTRPAHRLFSSRACAPCTKRAQTHAPMLSWPFRWPFRWPAGSSASGAALHRLTPPYPA